MSLVSSDSLEFKVVSITSAPVKASIKWSFLAGFNPVILPVLYKVFQLTAISSCCPCFYLSLSLLIAGSLNLHDMKNTQSILSWLTEAHQIIVSFQSYFLLLNFFLDPSKQVIFNLSENFCLVEIKYEPQIQALCTILRFLVGTLKEWKEITEMNFIMYI